MTTHSLSYSDLGNRSRKAMISDLMDRAVSNPHLLSLAAGFTANQLLPVDIVKNVFNQLIERSKDTLNHEYLQYGTTQGRLHLRQAIAKRFASFQDEIPDSFQASHIAITNGSQQALYLTIQVLCNPGDIVLVESPSYFVFLELLQGLGVHPVAIPTLSNGHIDFHGLDTILHDLQKNQQIQKIKALYLVSYYSNPSTKCLSTPEKAGFGPLFDKYNIHPVVMEDAAYRELFFETPHPSPSIHSIPSLSNYTRIYFGTFTKSFSTGLKVGFACSSDKDLLDKILSTKAHQDFGSANFNQAIIEAMLENNYYDPYLNQQRLFYQKKARILSQALKDEGLERCGWKWSEPQGGLFIWLQGPSNIDTSAQGKLCNSCIEKGVIYVPGNLCFANSQPNNCIRLSYGILQPEALQEASKRLALAIKENTL